MQPALEVWHTDPEPVGWLELPDGSTIDVYPSRPSFGFGRWLDERDTP